MKRTLAAISLAAALLAGHGGTASAAGSAGATATNLNAAFAPAAAEPGLGRPEVQLTQGWYEPRPRWRDRRHWRDWDRRHYRDRGPRFGIYIEPRPRYVEPRRVYRLSRAHYRWCEARYRSYRARDNTFQPYNGPRRQCISPYI